MPLLTAATLSSYKPHATQRREIPDTGAPGLYLIVQPKPRGNRSWVLRYRDSRGKSVKLLLGTVDTTKDADLPKAEKQKTDDPKVGEALTLADAHMLAATLQRERQRGVDLVARYAKSRQRVAADKAEAHTFTARAIEFFRDHKSKRSKERPRRWHGDARLMGLAWPANCKDPSKVEPQVIPASLAELWGKKPVKEITRHEIEDIVADAKAKGIPGLAIHNTDISENRGRKVFAILSSFFTWLTKKRYAENDPTVGIEAPMAPKARSRVLTGAELRWFWLAADRQSFPYGPAAKLLLLTGQRLVEVSGMRRDELNEDASSWSIPPSRTKNHREHLLPLPMAARDIIASVSKIEGGFVFSPTGKGAPTGWSHAKAALDLATAEIARKERGTDVTIERWVLHDLRRSLATGLQGLGVRTEVIERALNHRSGSFGGIVGTYQHDPLTDDVRDALNRWSRYIALVTDAELFAAHEAFLLRGDDDERRRSRQHFLDAIAEGGAAWQGYLDLLAGKAPPKVADIASARKRKQQ
jgi:integrase